MDNCQLTPSPGAKFLAAYGSLADGRFADYDVSVIAAA
jgi:hypothetical protein